MKPRISTGPAQATAGSEAPVRLHRMVRAFAWFVVAVGRLAFGTMIVGGIVFMSWAFVDDWPNSGIGLAVAVVMVVVISCALALWSWARSVVGRGDSSNDVSATEKT